MSRPIVAKIETEVGKWRDLYKLLERVMVGKLNAPTEFGKLPIEHPDKMVKALERYFRNQIEYHCDPKIVGKVDEILGDIRDKTNISCQGSFTKVFCNELENLTNNKNNKKERSNVEERIKLLYKRAGLDETEKGLMDAICETADFHDQFLNYRKQLVKDLGSIYGLEDKSYSPVLLKILNVPQLFCIKIFIFGNDTSKHTTEPAKIETEIDNSLKKNTSISTGSNPSTRVIKNGVGSMIAYYESLGRTT
jgi:hypothetical protein